MGESDKKVALILAGGSGTRFWPLSKAEKPKQFLQLFSGRSLIQETYDRVRPIFHEDEFAVCAAKSQASLIDEHLPTSVHKIYEPLARNTAPALLLSTVELLRAGMPLKTAMVVLPADHYISNADRFRRLLNEAIAFAQQADGLVTFGVVPTMPHTGYGYIEVESGNDSSAVRKVKRFVEKPDAKTAEKFITQGNYYWNSGMFVWTLETLSLAFQELMPKEWKAISQYRTSAELEALYANLPSSPIDIAILEKSDNVFVFPASDIGWSDIGSWDALYKLQADDGRKHVVNGATLTSLDSAGCLVQSQPGKKVALVGVQDLIIVDTGDTLLVAHRSKDQLVRQAAQALDIPPPRLP